MARTRRDPTGHLVTLTAAQTAGQAGTWAGYVAALPTALTQPHPAVAVSIITAAWTIPSVFAWLAGSLIDRHGPRRTGAAAWSLAAVAALVPAATGPTLPILLPVLAALALGGTWGVSAGEAAPTWMPSRPDPATAGSWLAAATNLTLIIGPAGASNLLTYTSDRAAWVLVAALSLAAALTTLRIPAAAPAPAVPASQQPGQDPARVRAVLALTAGFYLTLGLITVAEPLYVRQLLRAGLPVYGWLLAIVGAAGILTAIAAGHRDTIITGRWAVPAAALTVAAGQTLYLTTPILACAFAGAAVFGAGSTVFRLSARAIIVRNSPSGQHGRVLSGWETVQCLPSVISTAATGPLISLFGLSSVLRGCSALATVIAAASLRPTLRTRTSRDTPTIHPVPGPPSLIPQEAALHHASQQPLTPTTGTRPVNQTPWPPPVRRLDPARVPASWPSLQSDGASKGALVDKPRLMPALILTGVTSALGRPPRSPVPH